MAIKETFSKQTILGFLNARLRTSTVAIAAQLGILCCKCDTKRGNCFCLFVCSFGFFSCLFPFQNTILVFKVNIKTIGFTCIYKLVLLYPAESRFTNSRFARCRHLATTTSTPSFLPLLLKFLMSHRGLNCNCPNKYMKHGEWRILLVVLNRRHHGYHRLRAFSTCSSSSREGGWGTLTIHRHYALAKVVNFVNTYGHDINSCMDRHSDHYPCQHFKHSITP